MPAPIGPAPLGQARCTKCHRWVLLSEFSVNSQGQRKKLCSKHDRAPRARPRPVPPAVPPVRIAVPSDVIDNWSAFCSEIQSWKTVPQVESSPVHLDCLFYLAQIPFHVDPNRSIKEQIKIDRKPLDQFVSALVQLLWEMGGYRFSHKETLVYSPSVFCYRYICCQDSARRQKRGIGLRNRRSIREFACRSNLYVKINLDSLSVALRLSHLHHKPYPYKDVPAAPRALEDKNGSEATRNPTDTDQDLLASEVVDEAINGGEATPNPAETDLELLAREVIDTTQHEVYESTASGSGHGENVVSEAVVSSMLSTNPLHNDGYGEDDANRPVIDAVGYATKLAYMLQEQEAGGNSLFVQTVWRLSSSSQMWLLDDIEKLKSQGTVPITGTTGDRERHPLTMYYRIPFGR